MTARQGLQKSKTTSMTCHSKPPLAVSQPHASFAPGELALFSPPDLWGERPARTLHSNCACTPPVLCSGNSSAGPTTQSARCLSICSISSSPVCRSVASCLPPPVPEAFLHPFLSPFPPAFPSPSSSFPLSLSLCLSSSLSSSSSSPSSSSSSWRPRPPLPPFLVLLLFLLFLFLFPPMPLLLLPPALVPVASSPVPPPVRWPLLLLLPVAELVLAHEMGPRLGPRPKSWTWP